MADPDDNVSKLLSDITRNLREMAPDDDADPEKLIEKTIDCTARRWNAQAQLHKMLFELVRHVHCPREARRERRELKRSLADIESVVTHASSCALCQPSFDAYFWVMRKVLGLRTPTSA